MPRLTTPEEIDGWLAEGGWHPGRDIGAQAASEAIAAVVEAYRKDGTDGVDIAPSSPAVAFIREHAFIKVLKQADPDDYAEFGPVLAFKGQAEEIEELGRDLGTSLFPVGWDTYEGGTLLVDENDRFFYAHWSGNHYLGSGKYAALISLMTDDFKDADDLHVRPPRQSGGASPRPRSDLQSYEQHQ
ncbi:SUKH-3 domain-containing protein [Streptomyces uncialis]|uniref:SUKH-3 domain-containing protein n=1 Tax=Streptomyces uncialis TaxID=1048205 RepID=UPI0037BBBA27|nr:SUKH-3 domain-containing protein [Streptomyces uncialis]